jgi:hypothetical protein
MHQSPPRTPQPPLLGHPTLRRPPPILVLRSTVLANRLRDSFVRACAARPIISGPGPAAARRGGDLQPSLIRVDGTLDVLLAIHVVRKTADGLRAGGVADEARHEVVHERGVV